MTLKLIVIDFLLNFNQESLADIVYEALDLSPGRENQYTSERTTYSTLGKVCSSCQVAAAS